MLDPKCFRQELAATLTQLKQRGVVLDTVTIQEFEEQRRALQMIVQELQNERNQLSKEIGHAKSRGDNVDKQLLAVQGINETLAMRHGELDKVLADLDAIYSGIPNLPDSTVPCGMNSEDNVEIRKWGKLREFSFVVRDHAELGGALGMIDFARAAKITGTRFVVLYNKIAKLQRALAQFMLDIHTREHGYQEIYVPHLVNRTSLFGTGQLPKFGSDLFHLGDDLPYSLLPTAEVAVTNLWREEIIPEEKLPLKYVACTPCYRSEAGSYGRDLHGMIRQHQFEKVELVHFVLPEQAIATHEELTKHAEKILQLLDLPYRVVTLCAGDLGFAAAKTYDLEVWLPSQQQYREISSCSNCTSFQARRMQIRVRRSGTGKIELVHTLNGSGLAVGRALVALLENYQEANGAICIPELLWGYMGGEKIIEPI